MPDLVRLLLSLQSDSGAFQSTAHIGGRFLPDDNGFVTALVLRELEPLASSDPWPDPCRRALDYLEECASPFNPGFFAFWPRWRWPDWAPAVPDDSDDTATIASELLHYGRIDLPKARAIAAALVPYRLTDPTAPIQPWERVGAFLTWLDHRCDPNPIDCCVNVNILAFLAQADFTAGPGYRQACDMISAGILWCARRWENLERLSPYYPEGFEFLAAIQNAVHRGAAPLRASLEALQEFPPPRSTDSPSRILFSIADRSTVWSSTAVWAARRLACWHRGSFNPVVK